MPQRGTGSPRRGAAETTSHQDRPGSPGRAGSSGRPSAHRSALHSQGKDRTHHTLCAYSLSFVSFKPTRVHLLKKSQDHFLDLCPTYWPNDKVMKLCKNSPPLFFFFFFSISGDLARDPLLRSSSKETSFNVSIKYFLSFSPLPSVIELISAQIDDLSMNCFLCKKKPTF